ncbi:MAG: hypothetical protein ACOVN2_13675 [Usitatibacteraceae bacterium]
MTRLRPFDPRVSDGSASITLAADGTLTRHDAVEFGSINGWFGVYDGKLFAVFCDADAGGLFLHVDGRTIAIPDIVSTRHSANLRARILEIELRAETVLFTYQDVVRGLVRNPAQALSNIVFADDWWGVVCDLPAWLHDNRGWLASSDGALKFLSSVRNPPRPGHVS